MPDGASGGGIAALSSADHLPALDGVRGLAILLVLVLHLSDFAQALWAASSPLDRLVLRLTSAGWVGVDLFFVLSGFLITGILVDAKERAGYFRNFYARRVLRIFPLYYGFLIVIFLLLPLIPRAGLDAPLRDQLTYWPYLQNMRGLLDPGRTDTFFHDTTGHLWSLAVEEQFYLVWPAILLPFARTRLMWICSALIAGALVFRVAIRAAGADSDYAYILMPARIDSLALGALLALAARSKHDLGVAVRLAPVAAGVSAAIVAAIFLWRHALDTNDILVQTIGYTALAVLFGALVISAATSRPGTLLHAVFTRASMRTLGRYSYGMYVIHIPIIVLLSWTITQTHGDLPAIGGLALPGTIAFSLAGGAATFALAWLSWHVWEQRWLRLKTRFRSAPSSPAAQAPPAAAQAVQALSRPET